MVLGWPGGPPPLWRRQSDAVNARLLDRWLPASGLHRVLKTDLFDELTGEGLFPHLRSRARHVMAIDISPLAVSRARRVWPDLDAYAADAAALPFPDAHFDAVISNSTLDHLERRLQVVGAANELARVLRPGGRLVITLDNPVNPLIAVRNRLPRRLARRLREVPYEPGWTCGPRGLRRLLAQAGFEVREMTAVLHVPRLIVARADRFLGSGDDEAAWLARLVAAERLERLPTRFLTGHFVAGLAVRREPTDDRPEAHAI